MSQAGANNNLGGGDGSTDLHVARFIVSPGFGVDGANYSTINSAYAAAVSAGGNQTVFIQPGTYTENLTLSQNINLSAFICDGTSFKSDPNVVILGELSASYSGNCSISGIGLKTNGSNPFLNITGSNPTNLMLINCQLDPATNTGINFNSSTAVLFAFNCTNKDSTTNAMFNVTTTGGFSWYGGRYQNIGNTTPASTIAAGTVDFYDTIWSFPISTSGTGSITGTHSHFSNEGVNLTTLNFSGTGTNYIINSDVFASSVNGNSAVSIGTGGTAIMANCSVSSSNVNAITGLGTLEIGEIDFYGSSSNINVSNIVPLTSQGGALTLNGIYKNSAQPAFMAHLANDITNATGNGAAAVVIYDTVDFQDGGTNYSVSTGIFTAPVAGKYLFTCNVQLTSVPAGVTDIFMGLFHNTTTYRLGESNQAANFNTCGSLVLNLSANDTVKVDVTASGGAGNTASIFGTRGSDNFCTFSGCMLA